jgi:hypothetical protein
LPGIHGARAYRAVALVGRRLAAFGRGSVSGTEYSRCA